MDEPRVLLYTSEFTPSDLLRHPTEAWMNGSWRYEGDLPIKRTQPTTFHLDRGWVLNTQTPVAGDSRSESFEYDPTVGVCAGLIAGEYSQTTLPIDQRGDEAGSLVYTTAPLESDMEVTGQPEAVIYVSSTADVTAFSVKLCDVAPDGSSMLVSRYYMNATHRASRSDPSPLKPSEVYELRIPMNFISHRFLKGHRVKLMVSSADFPHLWPTPKRCVNTLHYGVKHPSRLVLPVIPKDEHAKPVQLPSPDIPPSKSKLVQPDYWRIYQDKTASIVKVEWGEEVEMFPDEQTKAHQKWHVTATTRRYSPEDMRVEAESSVAIAKPGSVIDTRARTVIQSDQNFYHVSAEVEIDYDGVPHVRKTWSSTNARKLC